MPPMGQLSRPPAFKGLVTVLLVAFLTSGQKACPNEAIMYLTKIMERTDNSSDARLYTPENFTVRIFSRCYIMEVCYANNLECFRMELEVIWSEEEEEERKAALCNLSRRLAKLAKSQNNCLGQGARCQPCECHPERLVPFFLHKLQQLLQWGCRTLAEPCMAQQRKTCWPLQ